LLGGRSFSPSSLAVHQGRSASGFCRSTSGFDASVPRCICRPTHLDQPAARQWLGTPFAECDAVKRVLSLESDDLRNFTPRMTFANWLCPWRRHQLFSVASDAFPSDIAKVCFGRGGPLRRTPGTSKMTLNWIDSMPSMPPLVRYQPASEPHARLRVRGPVANLVLARGRAQAAGRARENRGGAKPDTARPAP
jgi:hypothetical protein